MLPSKNDRCVLTTLPWALDFLELWSFPVLPGSIFCYRYQNIFLSYFSVDFRLKIFLNYSTYSTAHEIPTLECIGVSIASVLCLDWSVLLLSERNNLSTYKNIIVLWFTDFQHKKFRPTQNLSLGLLLIVFLKFS